MVRLTEALKAWGTEAFEAVLRNELAALGCSDLPLQQGLTRGSHALDDNLSIMIIRTEELPAILRIRAGVHYRGLIAGCSCADDPTPLDTTTEYCEIELTIDKGTAETRVLLLGDEA